jgi:hypothetical protein
LVPALVLKIHKTIATTMVPDLVHVRVKDPQNHRSTLLVPALVHFKGLKVHKTIATTYQPRCM